jgi:hypothetical protein
MYPPVDPIIFEIGPFALRWYGLLGDTWEQDKWIRGMT